MISPSNLLTSLIYRVASLNFPDLSGSIPRDGSYGVFIAQTLRYAKACAKYEHFMDRTLLLKKQLEQQHFEPTVIDRKFEKWMERSEKAVVLKTYHTK